MTKKDYILIAKSFANIIKMWQDAREMWKESTNARHTQEYKNARITEINRTIEVLKMFFHDLSQALRLDNPRFNEAKFREACGLSAKPESLADVKFHNEPLICTARGCRELQISSVEFCKKHIPKIKTLERDCMNCEETFEDDGSHDYCKNCR